MHEIGHAIGVIHEQQRPDRSNTLTVHDEYLEHGSEGNFIEYTWDIVQAFGEPYDISSLWQYRLTVSVLNGRLVLGLLMLIIWVSFMLMVVQTNYYQTIDISWLPLIFRS